MYKMYITQCVLTLLSLYAGLAHSFSWEIVTSMMNQLEFYDVNGTLLMQTEEVGDYEILTIIYDPVHDRVLIADLQNIYSYTIASKTVDTLVTITNSSISSMTYDPATELLFWSEDCEAIYSISLKSSGFDNRVNEKQLFLSDNSFYDMTVDICGGFIHWISGDHNVLRARFDGSGKEVLTGSVSFEFINIDQQTQKMYWYDNEDKSIKCSDLNGKNIGEVDQVLRPRVDRESQKLTFSKDHSYWNICDNDNINGSIWKIPKNAPSDLDLFIERDDCIWSIAAKYSIEDLTRGVQNCVGLKSLLPKNTVNNFSSDVGLLCVHGTKVSGESRCECAQGYSGERCDVLV